MNTARILRTLFASFAVLAAPGGTSDIVRRVLAHAMGTCLKWIFPVENMAGGLEVGFWPKLSLR